jgi:Na+-transporting methylmalonyl-CoA/oxaloacetate decarboxylase gamma subunit
MSLSDSILVAIFCMVVVFAVLGILWAIIRIFSSIIRVFENRNGESSSETNQ